MHKVVERKGLFLPGAVEAEGLKFPDLTESNRLDSKGYAGIFPRKWVRGSPCGD